LEHAGIAVACDHHGALGREQLHGRPPDTGSRTRHDGDFVFQAHVLSLQDFIQRASASRSTRRRSLPAALFGNSVLNSMARGYLYGAVAVFTCSCNSSFSASEGAKPFRSTTKAFTISPRSTSGLPITAHSVTAGCSCSAF